MVAKKKKMGKVGPVAEKKVIPVETDPVKLVNYVCGSNYMQKGEDIKVTSYTFSGSDKASFDMSLVFPVKTRL